MSDLDLQLNKIADDVLTLTIERNYLKLAFEELRCAFLKYARHNLGCYDYMKALDETRFYKCNCGLDELMNIYEKR